MERVAVRRIDWSAVLSAGWIFEGAILFLAFLMPLMNHAATYESFELPKQLTLRLVLHTALALALAAWAVRWLCDRDLLADGRRGWRRVVSWPPLVVGALVVVAWTVVTAMGISPAVSFWGTWPRWSGWWTQMHYVILFLLAAATLSTHGQLYRLMVPVSAGAAISGAYALYQRMYRPHSTFGNPNFMADYITLALPLTLACAFAARRRAVRALWISSALLQIIAVYATETRASWVALSGGLPLLGILLVRQRGGQWVRLMLGLAVAGVVAGGGLFVFREQLRSAGPVGNLIRVFETRPQSANSRFVVWGTGLRLWLDKPLSGFGPDSFGTVAPRRLPAQSHAILNESNQELFDRAHNVTIDGLVATGAIGMGSLVVLAALVLWCGARLALPAGEEANAAQALGDGKHLRGHPLSIGLVASFATYWVAQQFSIESAGASSLAWTLAGIAVAAGLRPIMAPVDQVGSHRHMGHALRPPIWSLGAAAVFVLAVASLSGWWEYREMQGSIEFKRANGLARAERSAEATAAYERAADLWPFERRYWLELGFARRHAARNLNEAQVKSWLTQAVTDVERSIQIDPENPLYLSKWADVVGEVAQRLGDQVLGQKALEATQKALTIAPDRWLLWSDAGLTYLRLNKPVEARNALGRALMLYDRDWVIYARYGDANAAVGDKNTARRAYQTALAMVGPQGHQGVQEALARLGPE
jgi:O-antigen ligase